MVKSYKVYVWTKKFPSIRFVKTLESNSAAIPCIIHHFWFTTFYTCQYKLRSMITRRWSIRIFLRMEMLSLQPQCATDTPNLAKQNSLMSYDMPVGNKSSFFHCFTRSSCLTVWRNVKSGILWIFSVKIS